MTEYERKVAEWEARKAGETKTFEAERKEKASPKTLEQGYWDAKNASGKEYYDYVQRHKAELMDLFSESPNELVTIRVVPSLAEEIEAETDTDKRRHINEQLEDNRFTQDQKLKARNESIKDTRSRYRPDIAKLQKDEQLLDAGIRRDLKRQGYFNPSDEDVAAYKNKIVEENTRVKKANKWQEQPVWYRYGAGLVAPRVSESKSMGYDPSIKDVVLDVAEFGTMFAPAGLAKTALRFPKVSSKVARLKNAAQKWASGKPGLDMIGQFGQGSLMTALPEAGMVIADRIAYDDENRGRSELGMEDIAHVAAAGMLGGAAAPFSSEDLRIADKLNEAKTKNTYRSRQGVVLNKKKKPVMPLNTNDPLFENYKMETLADNIIQGDDLLKSPDIVNNSIAKRLEGLETMPDEMRLPMMRKQLENIPRYKKMLDEGKSLEYVIAKAKAAKPELTYESVKTLHEAVPNAEVAKTLGDEPMYEKQIKDLAEKLGVSKYEAANMAMRDPTLLRAGTKQRMYEGRLAKEKIDEWNDIMARHAMEKNYVWPGASEWALNNALFGNIPATWNAADEYETYYEE